LLKRTPYSIFALTRRQDHSLFGWISCCASFRFRTYRKDAQNAPRRHTEFLRLTKDDLRLAPDLRIFLSQGYNLKAVADYETGPGSKVSTELARSTIETGRCFVARIVELLSM
jgi:hypothetical protein